MSLPENDTSKLGSRESNLQRQDKQINGCRLLTGSGRSAIAVITVSGPDASDAIGQMFEPSTHRAWKTGVIRHGRWSGPVAVDLDDRTESSRQTASESVVVLLTESQDYEIHCHGGAAAVGRILDDLGQRGIPLFGDSSRQNTWHRESMELLSRCQTTRTAGIALEQWRHGVESWRNEAIDRLEQGTAESQTIAEEARKIVDSARVGLHLDRPWVVVLAGPPNVGKSSLINALVGYDRSITMDVAGTTRDVLNADTVIDGWPILLRDTAGLHASTEEIEQLGIARAVEAIREADLVIRVAEPGSRQEPSFDLPLEKIKGAPGILNVLNKSDLDHAGADDVPVPGSPPPIRTVAISGDGIARLQQEILHSLGLLSPPMGQPVAITRRQLVWAERVVASADETPKMISELRRDD